MVQPRKKYTKQNIETLLNLFETYKKSGKRIEYEVFVDGLKVVPRTSNTELFSDHEASVQADSNEIQVVVYFGKSQHNDRYTFVLTSEEIQPKANPFNGFGNLGEGGLGEIIDRRIREEREKWETDRLREQLKDKEQKISELNATVAELEGTIDKMESDRSPLNQLFGTIGGMATDYVLKKNPQLLAGLGELAPTDSREIGTNSLEAPEVSIKEKDRFDTLSEQLRRDFVSEEEISKLFKMIGFFARDRESLNMIYEQVFAKA